MQVISVRLLCLCLGAFPVHATAAGSFSYSVGEFHGWGLGNDNPSLFYDALDFQAVSSSTHLSPGVNQQVPFGGFTFAVGFTGSGSSGRQSLGTASRSFTFDGVSGAINHSYGVIISSGQDHLTVNPPSPSRKRASSSPFRRTARC